MTKEAISSRRHRSIVAILLGGSLGAFVLGLAIDESFHNLALSVIAVVLGACFGSLGGLWLYIDSIKNEDSENSSVKKLD